MEMRMGDSLLGSCSKRDAKEIEPRSPITVSRNITRFEVVVLLVGLALTIVANAVLLRLSLRPLRRLMGTGEDTSGDAAVEAAPAAREGTLPT